MKSVCNHGKTRIKDFIEEDFFWFFIVWINTKYTGKKNIQLEFLEIGCNIHGNTLKNNIYFSNYDPILNCLKILCLN